MKTLYFALILILFIGCDPITKKLELVNNSEKTMYCTIQLDTTLNSSVSQSLYELHPHDSIWPTLVSGKGKDFWKNYINKYSIDSTLYIYFFNTNKISDSILSKRMYERLELKAIDLDSLHWIVNYK